jgi:hypothetical protein
MGIDPRLAIGITVGAWAIPLIWFGGDFGRLPFPFIPAWAAFAYWAGYFAFGAGAPKFDTIKTVWPCHILGAFLAALTAVAWLNIGPVNNLSFALWVFPLCIAMCVAGHIKIFATTPAVFFGACISFGVYFLALASAPDLTPWQNFLNMIVIITVGVALGWLSDITAIWLSQKPKPKESVNTPQPGKAA